MSPDEQDAIVGKTVREKADIERQLATTDKLLSDIATELLALAGEINEWIAPVAPNPGRPFFASYSTLHRYADFSKIVNLAHERRSASLKLRNVLSHLSAMGIR